MQQGDGNNYAHSVSYNGSSPSICQRSSTGRAHTEAQEDLLKVEQYIQYLKNNKNKVEREFYHSFNEAVANHDQAMQEQQTQLLNLKPSHEQLQTQEHSIQILDSKASQQRKAQGYVNNCDQSSRILSPTTTASVTATPGTAIDTIQLKQTTQEMPVVMNQISASHNSSQCVNNTNNNAKINNQIIQSKLIHQYDSNVDQFNAKNNNFIHCNAEIKQSTHRSSSGQDKIKKKKRGNLNHMKSLVQKSATNQQIKGSVHPRAQGTYALTGNLTTAEDMSLKRTAKIAKATKVVHNRPQEHLSSCFRTSSDSSRNSRSTSRSSDAERNSQRKRKQRKQQEILAQRYIKLESMKEYMQLARKDPFNWNLFIGAFTSERGFMKSDRNKEFEMLFSLTLQILIQNLRNCNNSSFNFNSKSVGNNTYLKDPSQKLSTLQNQLNSIIQPISSSPLAPSSTKSTSQIQFGFQLGKDPHSTRVEKKIVPQLGFQNQYSALAAQQQQELSPSVNELQGKYGMGTNLAGVQGLERQNIQNVKGRTDTTHSMIEQTCLQKCLWEQQHQLQLQRQSQPNFQYVPVQNASFLEGYLQQSKMNSQGTNSFFRKDFNNGQFLHGNLINQVSQIAPERLSNNFHNLSRLTNQNTSSKSNVLTADQVYDDNNISNQQQNNQRMYKDTYGFDSSKNKEFEYWRFQQQKLGELDKKSIKDNYKIDKNNYASEILSRQANIQFQPAHPMINPNDNIIQTKFNGNNNSSDVNNQRNIRNDSQLVGIQNNRNKGNIQIPIETLNYARQHDPFEVRQSIGSMQSAGHFGLSTSTSSAVGIFNKYPFKNSNELGLLQNNQADTWDERYKKVMKASQNQSNSIERRESQRYNNQADMQFNDWKNEDGDVEKLQKQGKNNDKQTNKFKQSSRLQKSEQQLLVEEDEQLREGKRQFQTNGDSSPERVRTHSQDSHSTKQDNLDQLNQGDLSGYELSQFDSKSNQSVRTNTNNDDQTMEASKSKKSNIPVQKNRLTFKSKNVLTNPSDNSKSVTSQGFLRESISPSNKPDDRPSHFFKAQERNEQAIVPDILQIQRRAKPNIPKQTTFDIISHSQVTETTVGNKQK